MSAFPTSYIPTFGASATRAADGARIEGANFSAFYNATAGSLVTRSTVPLAVPATSFPLVASVGDGTSANRLEVGFITNGSAGLIVRSGGASVADLYPPASGATRRIAAAYAANDFAVVANGGAAMSSTSGDIFAANRLVLGSRTFVSGVTALNGTIASLDYYPRRLPNSRLQELTA